MYSLDAPFQNTRGLFFLKLYIEPQGAGRHRLERRAVELLTIDTVAGSSPDRPPPPAVIIDYRPRLRNATPAPIPKSTTQLFSSDCRPPPPILKPAPQDGSALLTRIHEQPSAHAARRRNFDVSKMSQRGNLYTTRENAFLSADKKSRSRS